MENISEYNEDILCVETVVLNCGEKETCFVLVPCLYPFLGQDGNKTEEKNVNQCVCILFCSYNCDIFV